MAKKRKGDRDGIRRRDDRGGRYEIQWQGVDPETGGKKRMRKLLPTKKYATAQQERARMMQLGQQERPRPIADVTLNHFEEEYLRERKKKEKGFRTKKGRVKRILEILGDRRLEQLVLSDYEAFVETIIGNCTANRRPQREQTANRYISTLKAMIHWGIEHNHVPEEVRSELRKLKKFPETPGRVHFFYIDDVCELLAAASNPELCGRYMRPLILLALGTGIRRGDLYKLRWRDVDEVGGMIHVGGASGTDTKGGRSYSVEIGGIARLGLQEAKKWLKANGKPISDSNFVIDWRSRDRMVFLHTREYPKILKASGIDSRLTFHCLRHSYPTWALAHGENLVNVKHWMGHASIKTTERYLHALPRNRKLRGTVNPLDENSDHPFKQKIKRVAIPATSQPSSMVN